MHLVHTVFTLTNEHSLDMVLAMHFQFHPSLPGLCSCLFSHRFIFSGHSTQSQKLSFCFCFVVQKEMTLHLSLTAALHSSGASLRPLLSTHPFSLLNILSF
ncbi:unnamed protein product [Sphenostylis stenocarpa]|uniref:Uncharacterized protein n=1 Tax=Sphenostylis stenocarpa TaxID=92480 RepID=A0AA87B6P0_9FABA|nr:unnamed protein product [Sphenostylis stenocarpa]